MPIFFRYGLILVLLLLSSCSLWPTDPKGQQPANLQDWQQHQQQVSQLDGWQIRGKLGIQSTDNGGSGTLFWLQRQHYFDIRLAGPLGQGATRLTGRPGEVLLTSSQGQFQADSPEELLESQLGWRLPVSNLLWWVRGLPAPQQSSPAQLQFNPHSRLQELQQDNWHIQYQDYVEYDGYWLPTRLMLQGQQLKLTLVIKEWQPRRLGTP